MSGEVSHRNVLVADGDPAVAETYRRHFERAGWRVNLVTDGDTALKELTGAAYDVVITDYTLPQIDGLRLLKDIRERNPSQPVIVMLASGGVREAIAALKAGACDVVSKPFDLDTLEQSVRRALSSGAQAEFESAVYRGVLEEESKFSFTCAELSPVKMPLLIADKLYKAGRVDQNTRLRLDLAFQEVMTNAVEHGCLELDSHWREEINAEGVDRYSEVKRARLKDPHYASRRVTVRIMYNLIRLVIEVQDEGPGFLNGRGEALIVKGDQIPCHGRGLSIIKGSVDEVSYHDNGSRVTLVKYL